MMYMKANPAYDIRLRETRKISLEALRQLLDDCRRESEVSASLATWALCAERPGV